MSKTPQPPAVVVKNGFKNYGKGPVLDNLDMKVPAGTTYALLGSSGCGKTTLLSSLVGLRKLTSGSVQLFGAEVSKRDIQAMVGYMPQEIGLHSELTISEEFHFFGRLYGMDCDLVEKKIQFFVDLLQLPSPDSVIQNLSGGQARRVSLAVSLLHSPRLVILDEATVGVDPLLRQSIWEHLYRLVKEDGVSLICSTHYTEEARLADVVSVMRNGRLLVEENPAKLLEKFGLNLLEDVVLKLCHSQELETGLDTNDMNSWDNNNITDCDWDGSILNISYKRRGSIDYLSRDSFSNEAKSGHFIQKIEEFGSTKKSASNEMNRHLQIIYAVFILNLIKFKRLPSFLGVMLIFPAIQCILAWSIHKPETHAAIGVVNFEQPNCFHFPRNETQTLGCEFVHHLILAKKLELEPYVSEALALEAVKQGQNFGYLVIPANFSAYSTQRVAFGRYADEETLKGSSIPLHLDLSHYVRNLILFKGLGQGFKDFTEKKLEESSSLDENGTLGEESSNLLTLLLKPFKMNQKLSKLGAVETNWCDKAAIMFLTSLTLIMPSVLGVMLVWDRKTGVFQRTLIGGVGLKHILISSLASYGLVYLGQMAFIVGALKFIEIPFQGAMMDVFILNYGQSLIGVIIGIFLGLVLHHELETVFAILAIFMTCFLAGGGLQTIETMDPYTRLYVVSLPTRLQTIALENILFRGWSILNPAMASCFAVQGAWIVGLLLLTTIVYRRILF